MKRFISIIVAVVVALSVSAQELNVGTINIRNGRSLKPGQERPKKGDYSKFNGWDDRKRELCDMINFMSFDLFGAQEVRHGQLEDMLAMCPDYAYIGEGRDGGTKGEYCPVFYKKDEFKLLDSGTLWISETPDRVSRPVWNGKYNRIWTWGYFQRKSDKSKFYFISTHFSNNRKTDEGAMNSAKLVLGWIKENCKGKDVILVGDFNASQFKGSYKYITENGMDDCYELAKYRYAPTGTGHGFRANSHTSRRIDHIFVSDGVKVSRYGILTLYRHRSTYAEQGLPEPEGVFYDKREVKTLSDHHPVQAFVTLKHAGRSKKNRK